MGRPVHALRLVPGSDAEPESQGDAALAGHPLGQDPDSSGQHGSPHLVAALGRAHQAAVLVVEFFGKLLGVETQCVWHGDSQFLTGGGHSAGRRRRPARRRV
ncbi:hypothetical protein [Rothia koreensis]|uniref:hypothetical protein n=1 Tax=Rothia koreensis TaxID=592378 RepID=UPI003FCC5D8B